MVENDDPFAEPVEHVEAAPAAEAETPVEQPVAEEQPVKPEAEPHQQILYGSSTLPATFEIDGDTVQLGTIVSAAFETSGLTEDAWNDLSDEDRDALLNDELTKRGYVAPAHEAEMVENEPVNDVGGFIDGDTLVPMTHPDNGSCDAYETVEGKLMVPAIDVPLMVSHGFVVDA